MTGKLFEGKVALVTGGGSGIGRAASQRLAQEGAQVVVADLSNDTALQTVALIESAGGSAVAIAANIADATDNETMFNLTKDRFGGIDLALLNAGMLQPYMKFEELSLDIFDRVMSVNLRGTFMGLKLAQAYLREGGACVVTASAAGVLGFSEAAAYSASKHGVIGLVRSAARAFAARGLRVNAICPGHVATAMNNMVGNDSLLDELDQPEYRGLLSAQHVADVALLLLCNRSAGVNGHAQIIDAGGLASFPPLDL